MHTHTWTPPAHSEHAGRWTGTLKYAHQAQRPRFLQENSLAAQEAVSLPDAQAPELGSRPQACPQLGQELWVEETNTEGRRTGGRGSHTAFEAGSADQTVRKFRGRMHDTSRSEDKFRSREESALSKNKTGSSVRHLLLQGPRTEP